VVRGGTDALLNSLHPSIHYADGILTSSCAGSRLVDLAGRRLALLPMIAGPGSVFVSFDLPDLVYLAYPITGAIPSTGAPADALALVLGGARAAVLRALSHPLTVSQLAVMVQYAPSTVSYHCQHLEAAGLVNRTGRGRFVQVGRTVRGAELIDLLCDDLIR
jgi:DNA-binding transcriptional ArsR family regulator